MRVLCCALCIVHTVLITLLTKARCIVHTVLLTLLTKALPVKCSSVDACEPIMQAQLHQCEHYSQHNMIFQCVGGGHVHTEAIP